jgi:hypothetical protein
LRQFGQARRYSLRVFEHAELAALHGDVWIPRLAYGSQ